MMPRRTQPMRVAAFRLGRNQDTMPSDRGRSAAQTGNVGLHLPVGNSILRALSRHAFLLHVAAAERGIVVFRIVMALFVCRLIATSY